MDGAGHPRAEGSLVVDVRGFEGPLDLLLALARRQKVDLREVSVLQLAEQYLAAMDRAALLRIDLAADWLVMAAWLAYLKSRLLVPGDAEPEPEAEEMARDLAHRLRRLDAFRDAAAQLLARPRLGRERHARGEAPTATGPAPGPVPSPAPTRAAAPAASLHDLLAAYARVRTRDDFRPFALDREGVHTMEEALARLRPVMGHRLGWAELHAWLPDALAPSQRRAATAATFAAVLELVREGLAELRQDAPFAPLLLRGRPAG